MASEQILVVEDSSATINFLTQDVLPRLGYVSRVARTGREGLQEIESLWLKLEATGPALILLDLQLPDMLGTEIIDYMHRQHIDIPVILMTAYGSEGTAVQAFRKGVKDYLIKPFSFQEIAEAIERALRETRLRRERDALTLKLQQQVQEMRIMARIGQSVTSLLNLDQLLNRIVEAGVFITHAEEGFLVLVDKETDELYLQAAKNVGEARAQRLRIKIQDSLTGQVVMTGQPLRLGGSAIERNFKVKTDYLVKALLHVPLQVRGAVIGVLSVDNHMENRAFTLDDQIRLSILADYAAIAIENAELHEALQERARRLERAYADLQEADRLKEQFIQNVSHELRTPLTFIKGYLELMMDGAFGELSPEQREPVRVMLERTNTVTTMVGDILTLQRGDQTGLHLVPMNLADAAWEALRGAEGAIKRAGLDIEIDIPDPLPLLLGDHDSLVRVFDNLLLNSIKFSSKGGRISVRLRCADDHIIAEVADTGIGIPEDQLGRIFERFYQVDGSSTRRHGGVGLGLTIVKQVIEAHGGEVGVSSQVGQGSIFFFSLPILKSDKVSETVPVQTEKLP
jgi:signal transduction histidine kinase/DNA-binding response OmpR family regulator